MSAEKAKMLAMMAQAIQMRERAYAPYSQFAVGAAVEGASGKVYAGCNVENASYGLTVCAERVAIWSAVSEGEAEIRSVVIAVSGDEIAPPCGACLQVMAEFAPEDYDVTITVCSAKNEYDVFRLADLLPMPFRFEIAD